MNDISKLITCYFCYSKLEVVVEIDLSLFLWHRSLSPLFSVTLLVKACVFVPCRLASSAPEIPTKKLY